MSRYGVVVLSIVMAAAMVVLAGACGTQGGGTQQQVGKMRSESKSVDPKDAQSARFRLKKVNYSYVNDAYGESDTNLTVDVKGGVGEINLKVV